MKGQDRPARQLARRLLTDVVATAERHLADPGGIGLAGYF
jgi:hypothetical protein